MRFSASLIILILLCWCPMLSAAEEEGTRKRFAMIAGANNGGRYRIKLRYAASDARAMSEVLEDLGGVPEKNQVFLTNPERADVWKGLDDLQVKMEQARNKGFSTEFFFYYSGHSDEEGLLLYGQRLAYRDLRRRMKELPADVRIVILDSCSSGAMTRSKGGKRTSPFLSDTSVKLKGHAFLTSSAADEASQESDRIGGSFFTHYLVTGLRGAADMSGDRRVSLNEAYHYAFSETLGRTETTRSGAQHPTYDIQLSGTGDLVLTELRDNSASLSFSDQLSGRLYVRDGQGRLVAELSKTPEREIELGLEPGDYRVVLDRQGDYYVAETSVALGGRGRLSADEFTPVDSESTVARGADKAENMEFTRVPFNIGLFPPAHINRAYDKPVENNFSIGLLASQQEKLTGVGITFGMNWQDYDMTGLQASFIANVTERDSVGVAFSYFVNYTGRDGKGVQFATIYNHNGRHFYGAQWGLVNYTGGNFVGAQGALANFAVGNFKGAQLALANVTIDHVVGTQIGLANVTIGNMSGAQASMLNVTTGDFRGAQLALLNINTGQGKSRGSALGLVNVHSGEIHGTQLGLINYSEYVDVPIGLINIVRKGILKGQFWTSDTGILNIALKHGSKYIYNIYALGIQPRMDSVNLGYGFGMGGHIPINDKWYIDLDAISWNFQGGDDLSQAGRILKFRFIVGWKFHERRSIIFGPTLNINFYQKDDLSPKDTSYIPRFKVAEYGDHELHLGPGFIMGIEI